MPKKLYRVIVTVKIESVIEADDIDHAANLAGDMEFYLNTDHLNDEGNEYIREQDWDVESPEIESITEVSNGNT